MRHLYIFSFLLISLISSSQKLEVFSGINSIQFFDTKNDLHNYSNYDSSPSFSLGIGLDDLIIDSIPLRVTFGFDSYRGSAGARSGGLGGGRSTNVKLRKSLLSIGLYLLNGKIYKNLYVNLGLVFSTLASESFSGTTSTSAGNIPTTIDLKEDRDKFNSSIYLGLQVRIKYDFQLKNGISIFPYYSFYFGILNEFEMFPKSTKSMRHHIGLGINFSLMNP